MHRQTRELVQIAERLGFQLDPTTRGSGHLSLVHDNGTVTIPSTPSDYRARKNAIAQLERVAGQRLERANHRRSHKRFGSSGFDPTLAARECAAWHAKHDAEVQELHERRDQLIADCRALARDRAQLKFIPGRLAQLAKVESQLDRLGVQYDAFNPLSLAQ